MGRLIHEKDWSATPLGPRSSWSRSLQNHLSMILALPTAAIVFWGPTQVQLYNDGYSVIMGPRHPKYLGASFRECWPEAYETIFPWMQRVLVHGETVEVNQTLVPLSRHGFTEDAYFTFSFSPLRDDRGEIAGILQLVTEVTGAVLGDRRAACLHELADQTPNAKTLADATKLAAAVLESSPEDLPLSLLYVADGDDRNRLVLSAGTARTPRLESFPAEVDLRSREWARIPELALAARERRVERIDLLARSASGSEAPSASDPTLAVALPIAAIDGSGIAGLLVVGIHPRLVFNPAYQTFLELVATQLANLLAVARGYDEERKQTAALAAIDRAKTEFFGNVSHEFRTPLTLMLGPLEDALADPARSLAGESLEIVHRSALRLLRLVNSLLDFARVEANRFQSRFEPTDLAVLTAGLAGAFKSLVESAGLRLTVECPALPEPVFVDRFEWEKIVLNLVSNAFKFTFEGEIAVRLRAIGREVELSVSDTGTGIPDEHLPKLFDRFHRVEGARGRSFEGSGIGLALVKELVRQHGGTVVVESVVGKGSTFVVRVPLGAAHLPPDRVAPEGRAAAEKDGSSAAYLFEAERWSRASRPPTSAGSQPSLAASPPTRSAPEATRVLVADDNADMRAYLERLLSTRWTVETVGDGEAALASIRRRAPDLVLSDVMMPRLDGLRLLRALRGNAETSTIPVVLLSARAGEEAVVGGLETGADDYLVKPFSARELLSRVATHLEMSRLRRRATEAATALAETRAALLADVARKNKELEAFSYSVSHDLRAPLRTIEGFSEILVEEHAEQLGPAGREHLARVCTASRRMGQLIDDLLKLSRVERRTLRRDALDLSDVGRRIMRTLERSAPDRLVDFVVESGLEVNADTGLVEILLENLLGNAWKFTSKKPRARIELGSAQKDGERVLFVRDNGAGFDPAYAQRLFAPFQRLHTEKEFPGTGVGLATVMRIVDRHGGRVWAEGEIDEGATVWWTLPVAAPEAQWG